MIIREKFQLATKECGMDQLQDKSREAIAQFDTSLKQTGAGYFDFYLLHNLAERAVHSSLINMICGAGYWKRRKKDW